VVAITGDGGFGLCLACRNWATAVQFNIGVVTTGFAITTPMAMCGAINARRFDGRVVASDLVNPDFVKLCRIVRRGRGARHIARDLSAGAGKEALAAGGPHPSSRSKCPGIRSQSVDVHIHPAKTLALAQSQKREERYRVLAKGQIDALPTQQRIARRRPAARTP